MPENESFAKSLTKEGVVSLLFEGVKAYIWPIMVVAMMPLAGYFEHIPWFFVIPFTIWAIATTIAGLLRFDEFSTRITARDKLNFNGPVLAVDYVFDPATGKPSAIEKAQVGIIIQSVARFPLSYIIEEVSSSVDGTINQHPLHEHKGGVLSFLAVLSFRDDPIDMKNTPIKPALEGTFKVKIRYGRKGKEKYYLTKNLRIFSPLDPASGAYIAVNFGDATE